MTAIHGQGQKVMKNGANSEVTLIIGADSMIGAGLMTCLSRASQKVIGTTRKVKSPGDTMYFLDLEQDLSTWSPPWPVRRAYICAGVTALKGCRQDPERSARINVHGTIGLARALVKSGAFVIFLSSNQVFDGSRPNVEPTTPYHPVTEYGRQKAETERRLSQWREDVAIVRLTKIIGPNALIAQWSDSLRSGVKVRPFNDMFLAPVPLSTVVSVLCLIGDLRAPGVWQLSGERDISYAEAAYWGAEALGADPSLIEPRSVSESGLELEANPRNTTLNMDRIQDELGIAPPSIRRTIEQAFRGVGE